MSAVTPIAKNGVTYALFVSGRVSIDGITFLTQQTDEFQIGVMERPKGYKVKPHQHPPRDVVVHHTTEFLYVEEGKAEITVFDEQWNELHTHVVSTGDCLVFFRGGHALTMLERTRLLEVKQGPYPGDGGAKVFRGSEEIGR